MVTCILAMLVVSVVPALLGWKTTVVVSGSMTPGIRPGDVIVAAPVPENAATRIKPGIDVLVDNPVHPGELLLHRFLRYDAQGRMILKGDANQSADSTPVPVENLRGLPRLRVPATGLPLLWLREGHWLPTLSAGVLLLALVAWQPDVRGENGSDPVGSAKGRRRATTKPGTRRRSRPS
jgi:signal peptidase